MRDFTLEAKTRQARITAGRALQCLARAKGDPATAAEFARSHREWLDSATIAHGLQLAAVAPIDTADFPASNPVSDAFLAALRSVSIPRQLALRRVPMNTKIFADAAGITGVEVTEGSAIPVLKGNWGASALTPRKFAGIVVLTEDLVRTASPDGVAAITDDLASAVADAENTGFANPDTPNSILNGASHFNATGSGVAQIDADLLNLCSRVPGASRPGAAFAMTKESATFLSLVRGSGGGAAYPTIGPTGGMLLGLSRR